MARASGSLRSAPETGGRQLTPRESRALRQSHDLQRRIHRATVEVKRLMQAARQNREVTIGAMADLAATLESLNDASHSAVWHLHVDPEFCLHPLCKQGSMPPRHHDCRSVTQPVLR